MGVTRVVIGVDGGGTTTRVACADLSGQVIAIAEGGSCHPGKDPNAETNVRGAITEALARARVAPESVTTLVAGLAGFNTAADEVWAERATSVPGLTGSRRHVNDALVAHTGALEGRPGIVAVSGTGSIVLGVTTSGRIVRNYDFLHMSSTHARGLALDALFAIATDTGEGEADTTFITAVCNYFAVPDVAALKVMLAENHQRDRVEFVRLFSPLARLVTAAAESDSPLARRVCNAFADALVLGIRLVASAFEAEEKIPVAFIGGVARSNYMTAVLKRRAGNAWTEPALPPVLGAVLMALRDAAIPQDANLIARLHASSRELQVS